MLDGLIRATKYHNAIDPQVIYNQEIFKNVKIHILQQKNHNFFVKQVMKTGAVLYLSIENTMGYIQSKKNCKIMNG